MLLHSRAVYEFGEFAAKANQRATVPVSCSSEQAHFRRSPCHRPLDLARETREREIPGGPRVWTARARVKGENQEMRGEGRDSGGIAEERRVVSQELQSHDCFQEFRLAPNDHQSHEWSQSQPARQTDREIVPHWLALDGSSAGPQSKQEPSSYPHKFNFHNEPHSSSGPLDG